MLLKLLLFISLFIGCNTSIKPVEKTLVDFTAEIQLGIENHIEEQSNLGKGFFKLAFDE